MPSASTLSLILCDVFLELRSDLVVMVLFGLFATGFVPFMNFRHKRKGIVVLWVLLLSFIVVRSAIIIQISHFNQEIENCKTRTSANKFI